MSDTQGNLPVNENPQPPIEGLENSTIFSDPVDYGTKNPKNKKYALRRVLIVAAVLVAAGALAGGWFAIQKFLPQTPAGTTSTSSNPAGTGVPVTQLDKDQVKSVSITAGDKSVVLLNVSAMEEKPDTVDKWVVQGVDPVVTSSNIVSYRVEDACAITALRTLASGQDYGMDKPTKVIEILLKDGSELTITVGKESPDKVGFYCKVSTDESKIYLVETSSLYLIEADPLHYADTSIITPPSAEEVGNGYFQGENSALNRFDSIMISGSKIDGKISLGMTKDTTKYNLYSLTAPITAFADEATVLDILAPVANGYNVSGAVSYNFSADKAKFGLDKPAYIADYKIGSYTEKIRVSVPDADGRCYMAVGEKPLAIYSTYITGLPFQNLSVTGLYTPYPFFENIVTVEQISLSGPKGNYTFDLQHYADAENNDDKLKAYCGETLMDTPSFRYFYQHLVKLSAMSFTTEKNSASPEVTIRIKFLEEGSQDTVLTLVRISDMRYHLSVNGTPYGIMSSQGVDALFADCATLVSGGKIEL